jgi:large subunit ribosomal protein L25
VKLAGAVQEQAFVRDLQWNTWGTHVLHIDFTRVSEHEKVKVLVSVETRGEAPGLRMGGVVKQAIHQVEIECEATSIPDRLFVNINHLNMGDKITVAQMELPPNVTILEAAEEIVVECAEPVEVVEEVAGAGAEAEPEVIGRKKEEEGEEEE